MSLDVVTFGEAMMLLVADRPGPLEDAESFVKRTAGAETNVAIGLARLGIKIGWASRLGGDSMGRYLLKAMQAEGIDCSRVVVDQTQRTGFQIKGRVAGGGDPQVESHRTGSAASQFQPEQIDHEWLTSARHLHATGVFPGISTSCLETTQRSMALMRASGRSISFDTNLRPALWSSTTHMRDAINGLAAHADWVLPGLEEGQLLTDADTPQGIASFYRKKGAALVVVKLGPDGAYYDSDAGCGFVPGYRVDQVVDTVGAGDGFAAGVVSGLLQGLSVVDAVKRGAWIGARCVQVLGDTEGLPTTDQLVAASL